MTTATLEHTDIVDAVLVEDEQEQQLIDDAKALLQSVEIGREDAGYLRLAHERQRAIREVLRMFQQAPITVPPPPIVAGIGQLFDQKYTEAATHMELARWGLKDHLPRADAWTPPPHKTITPPQFAEFPGQPPEFDRHYALAELTRGKPPLPRDGSAGVELTDDGFATFHAAATGQESPWWRRVDTWARDWWRQVWPR